MLTAFRLAVRSLLAVKGFAVTVIVTLGLGLTLCTIAIVVLNAYLLNDLPYPEADRLYWIRYGTPGQDTPRDMEKLDWASVSDVIEHPVAWDLDVFYMLGGDNVESIPVWEFSRRSDAGSNRMRSRPVRQTSRSSAIGSGSHGSAAIPTSSDERSRRTSAIGPRRPSSSRSSA